MQLLCWCPLAHECSCFELLGQLNWKVQDGFFLSWCCQQGWLGSPPCDLSSSNRPAQLLLMAVLEQHSFLKSKSCSASWSLALEISYITSTSWYLSKQIIDQSRHQGWRNRLHLCMGGVTNSTKKCTYQDRRNFWLLNNLPPWPST